MTKELTTLLRVKDHRPQAESQQEDFMKGRYAFE